MKRITRFLILAVLSISFYQAIGQASVGLTAGISPGYMTNNSAIIINRADPVNEFAFNTYKLGNSLRAGIFLDVELNESFFLEFSTAYQYVEVDYQVRYLTPMLGRYPGTTYYQEARHSLDPSIAIGVHLGNVDIKSGYFLTIPIDASTNLSEMEGYRQRPKNTTTGVLTSVKVNMRKFGIELGYRLEFENFGAQHFINDQNLALYNAPGRFIGTLSYRF